MAKIKDFLKTKLMNFKLFILDQINILQIKRVDINEEGINKLVKELDFYIDNLDKFITCISLLNTKDIDGSICLFLSQYSIDVHSISDHIDYDKLKRYIECFIDTIKK
jgi:hypothetical protein